MIELYNDSKIYHHCTGVLVATKALVDGNVRNAVSLSHLAVLRSGNRLLGARRGNGVLDVVRGNLQISQEAACAARVCGIVAAVAGGVAAQISEQAGDTVQNAAALLA